METSATSPGFEAHRPRMLGIAYRMLGSHADAQDVVQDAWLRWNSSRPGDLRSAEAWLVTTVTRLSIDRLRAAKTERAHYTGFWLAEPLLTSHEDSPERMLELAGDISLAFLAVLERLTPDERAAFLLREIFDSDYEDVAAALGKSEAACRQIVRRAKQSLQDNPPPATPPTGHARQLVETFLAATASGDVQQVLSLLSEDSKVLSDGGGRVTAAGRPILGADHVSRFLLGIWPRFVTRMEARAVSVNGQPGLLMLLNGVVQYAFSFDVVAGRIHAIYIICNPDKLRHLATAG